jgi:hypothetical protein
MLTQATTREADVPLATATLLCKSFYSVQWNFHLTDFQCSYTNTRRSVRRVNCTGCLPKYTPQAARHHSTQPRPITGPKCWGVRSQKLHSVGFIARGTRGVCSGLQRLSDCCYRIWWCSLRQCFWIQIHEHTEDDYSRGPELDLLIAETFHLVWAKAIYSELKATPGML